MCKSGPIAPMSICELQGEQQWLAEMIVPVHAGLGLCLLKLHGMICMNLMGNAFNCPNCKQCL